MENWNGKLILFILFLVGVVIWMAVFSGRIGELRRLSAEYDQAQETITALTATTEHLATQVVWAGSEEAVEEWAYEERRWIREGDQRLSLIPVKGTPATPQPVSTPTPEPENFFQIWWELFFSTHP